MDKTQYEQAWNAAVDWWFGFVDPNMLSPKAMELVKHNLEIESQKAFDEWYERNILYPPDAERHLTEGSF